MDPLKATSLTVTSLTVIGLSGIPEVQAGDDLAALLGEAAERAGGLVEGDLVVVSSKVVSKALGLWARGDARSDAVGDARSDAVGDQTVRVVAERLSGDRVTQIVQSTAGPIMAAAGVDASNTGGREDVLVLPSEPDAEADRLRLALRKRSGLTRIGVVVTDTAGRPWRSGQVDFALGAAGVMVVDDLRGRHDADGRPLTVTARALADELAAAADLVKGKADRIPAAIVRGTPWAGESRGAGAASLLRVGPEDWFDYGRAEAVRAALGVPPGSAAAREVGVASAAPEEVRVRLGRAVAVALHGLESVGADVGSADVRLSSDNPLSLGRGLARLEVALWGEGLAGELEALPAGTGPVEVQVRVGERAR